MFLALAASPFPARAAPPAALGTPLTSLISGFPRGGDPARVLTFLQVAEPCFAQTPEGTRAAQAFVQAAAERVVREGRGLFLREFGGVGYAVGVSREADGQPVVWVRLMVADGAPTRCLK